MTKNERIKRLERALVEVGLLLGYRINFEKYSILKPLPWRTTVIEKIQALAKELGIKNITLEQPLGRPERIKITKEEKNVRKTKKQTKSG